MVAFKGGWGEVKLLKNLEEVFKRFYYLIRIKRLQIYYKNF